MCKILFFKTLPKLLHTLTRVAGNITCDTTIECLIAFLLQYQNTRDQQSRKKTIKQNFLLFEYVTGNM